MPSSTGTSPTRGGTLCETCACSFVKGYDASRTQVGQLIAWERNEIEPGDRVYFDVTVPAGAATYDVSIVSWAWQRRAS